MVARLPRTPARQLAAFPGPPARPAGPAVRRPVPWPADGGVAGRPAPYDRDLARAPGGAAGERLSRIPARPLAPIPAWRSAGAPRPLAWPADDRIGRLTPPPGHGLVLYPGGAARGPAGRLAVMGAHDGAGQW